MVVIGGSQEGRADKIGSGLGQTDSGTITVDGTSTKATDAFLLVRHVVSGRGFV
jgi:hypothetical protein